MVTAQEFAQTWHRALFEEDMTQTWQGMTMEFRRVVAQVALGKAEARGEDVHATVEALSEAVPARADVREFFGAACTILQRACVAHPDAVGAGVTTRVEAPAYEVVRLYVLDDLSTDADGHRYLPPGESARALTLIASAEPSTSWRMAGIGRVMTTGWPPTVLWEPPPEV